MDMFSGSVVVLANHRMAPNNTPHTAAPVPCFCLARRARAGERGR